MYYAIVFLPLLGAIIAALITLAGARARYPGGPPDAGAKDHEIGGALDRGSRKHRSIASGKMILFTRGSHAAETNAAAPAIKAERYMVLDGDLPTGETLL